MSLSPPGHSQSKKGHAGQHLAAVCMYVSTSHARGCMNNTRCSSGTASRKETMQVRATMAVTSAPHLFLYPAAKLLSGPGITARQNHAGKLKQAAQPEARPGCKARQPPLQPGATRWTRTRPQTSAAAMSSADKECRDAWQLAEGTLMGLGCCHAKPKANWCMRRVQPGDQTGQLHTMQAYNSAYPASDLKQAQRVVVNDVTQQHWAHPARCANDTNSANKALQYRNATPHGIQVPTTCRLLLVPANSCKLQLPCWEALS